MSKDILHYNIDTIDDLGASINLLLGERSNGKSYQAKHKKGILPYLNDSVNKHVSYKDKTKVIEDIIKAKTRRFILLRRLREEIKSSLIVQYFKDIDVIAIKLGNLPLHGENTLVKIAISFSSVELIIRHPITPQALHP